MRDHVFPESGQLLGRRLRKIDIVHVVHAARDDHLKYAVGVADIAKAATHARWQGDRIELIELDAFAAIIIPEHLEPPAKDGKRFVGLPVGMQGRTGSRRTRTRFGA